MLRCQDIKYLILKGFCYGKKVGCDESDNFCLCFWHYRRPCPAPSPLPALDLSAPLHKAIDERGASRQFGERHESPITDNSEQVAHLELPGLRVQVALPLEVGVIEESRVMIDTIYRDAQGGLALAIAINDLL